MNAIGGGLVFSIGLALLAGGLAVALWSAWVLGPERFRGACPHGPEAPPLVFDGPYLVCAHPFYGGLAAASAGVACLEPSPPVILGAFAACMGLLLLARHEERRALIRFGEAYRRYLRSLPCRAWRGGGARRNDQAAHGKGGLTVTGGEP